MPPAHEALEDAADDEPARELHARARREEHRRAERGRDVDVPPARVRVAARQDVEGDRQEGADEDDVEEVVVTEERCQAK